MIVSLHRGFTTTSGGYEWTYVTYDDGTVIRWEKMNGTWYKDGPVPWVGY